MGEVREKLSQEFSNGVCRIDRGLVSRVLVELGVPESHVCPLFKNLWGNREIAMGQT